MISSQCSSVISSSSMFLLCPPARIERSVRNSVRGPHCCGIAIHLRGGQGLVPKPGTDERTVVLLTVQIPPSHAAFAGVVPYEELTVSAGRNATHQRLG